MYNLIEDLGVQKPNITYPQMLELSPSLRKQWSKLASTRITKRRSGNSVKLVRAKTKGYVLPVLDAWAKGQKVSRVYVDGGAQMCAMTERLMNKLKLDVDNPS